VLDSVSLVGKLCMLVREELVLCLICKVHICFWKGKACCVLGISIPVWYPDDSVMK
jgi:hypothetical protein